MGSSSNVNEVEAIMKHKVPTEHPASIEENIFANLYHTEKTKPAVLQYFQNMGHYFHLISL